MILLLPRPADYSVYLFEVISIVNPQDTPAIGPEPLRNAFAERKVGGSFDGDVVVVVEDDELAQVEVSRQGARLG